MIKLILIDIDDTLLDFNECSRYSMKRALEKRGMDYSDTLYETFHRINNGLWQDLERRIITKDELYRIRWNLIFKALGMDADGVDFERDFRRGLAESAILVDGAKELLSYLSEKYTVCAASNGPLGQQIGRMQKAGLLDLVQCIFASEEIGAPKPTKEFFDACFGVLDHAYTPDETMMIGDSITADIRGAVDYGMHSCWFNIHRRPLPEDCMPEHTVYSLSEIRNIL